MTAMEINQSVVSKDGRNSADPQGSAQSCGVSCSWDLLVRGRAGRRLGWFLSGLLLAWTAILVFGCPPGDSVYQPLMGVGPADLLAIQCLLFLCIFWRGFGMNLTLHKASLKSRRDCVGTNLPIYKL